MGLLSFDFSLLFSFKSLFAIVFGTMAGLLVGALPGLGAAVGTALLIPVTYTMEPLPAVLMLVALYEAAEYGGSISAIVLGIPGTSAAVATCLDGTPMAKQGYPGKALGYSLYSSTTGGLIGSIVLMTLTVPLAKLTIKFSDPELFLIGVLGMISVCCLSTKDIPKTIISIVFGLLLGTVGLDVLTGTERYTFGIDYLSDGIALVALLTGLFALSEVLNMSVGDLKKRYVEDTKNLKTKISLKEYTNVLVTIIKSAVIGVIAGIIPGLGGSAGSWFAYTEAKRSSKNPEKFGTGEPKGIAAPEAANNAVVSGALVPLLTLGIPGSPTAAIIASALMIQGIEPGPMVFKGNPDLVYGIFWGLLFATILMFVLGKYTTSLWARLLVIPNFILIPIVMVAALIGSYAVRGMFIDVWIAVAAGGIVFFLKKLDYSVPGFVLSFILAPMIERSFRRSLMLSHGSYSIFVSRGYSIGVLALIVLMVANMIYRMFKNDKKKLQEGQ